MRPVRTLHSNMVYVGPPGISDLHCERLEPGRILSVWELTPEERAAVASGSNISLVVSTEPHPPVMLLVTGDQGVGEDDPAARERLREWATQ